ncbi:hypothetical protein [Halomonas halocynthiae]|uniref:hypothetical protein n=1 Tax=Halomonas halocynthiae TaxID=176290 RepID=UPI0004148512|nr:hypothetical protein [Halomonas halocynthiae]
MKKRIIAGMLLASLVGLSGCQTYYPSGTVIRAPEVIDRGEPNKPAPSQPETPAKPKPPAKRVERKIAFPADEYAALKKTGTATISGRLVLPTQGGTVIGADETISVAPVTTYSAEAAERALAGRAVTKADPRAREYTHTTRSNEEGYFVLRNLPSGDFYVSGSLIDPNTSKRRIAIAEVRLAKGESKELQLSP